MRTYTFMVLMIALLGPVLSAGMAHADLFPNPQVYPLNVQINNGAQTIPIGGICTSGGCTTPTPAAVQVTLSGGVPPYSIIVTQSFNGGQSQQVASAATSSGFYEYDFTPTNVGTYAINVQVTDSATPPNSQTATATIIGSPQSNGGSGATSASLSISTATVNIDQTTPITLSIPNSGSQTYDVQVQINGNLMASTTATSSYTYAFTPQATGTYIVEFLVTDPSSGTTGTQTATIYAVPSGGSAVSPGGSSSSSGTLTISVSPTYQSVAAGTPVQITATASGGNSAIYNIVLNDGSGNEVGASQTSSLVATYTPYQAGTYYPLTAIVYDASHSIAQETIYLQTTQGSSSTSSGLSLSVTPSSATSTSGTSAQFTVTPSGGLAPYYLTVRDQYGDLLQAPPAISSSSPYVYPITEVAPGDYSFTFTITDSLGHTVTQTASLVVGSGSGGTTSPGGTSNTNGLSISVSPAGSTTATAGSSVVISAQASGGNSAIYNIVLDNGSGNQVASSQTGSLTYTYPVPSPSAMTYYPLTAIVYDASHNIAQQTIYIQVAGSGATST